MKTQEKPTRLLVHIRWMIRRDMEEVLDIERYSFPNPWPESEFIGHLKSKRTIGMVAEVGNEIVGYMLYELYKTRISVVNFAVASPHRRQRVGRQMIDKLIGKLCKERRNKITLEVSEWNLDAQLFFRSAGFGAVGILHGIYDEHDFDAYAMEYTL